MAYFPNASSADVLERQCEECPVGDQCPIAAVHFLFNYDQLDQEKLREAMRILVDDEGTCQLRKELMRNQLRKELMRNVPTGERCNAVGVSVLDGDPHCELPPGHPHEHRAGRWSWR